jgi:hypothetical protein
MTTPIRANNFIWMTLALIATMFTGALAQEFPSVTALHITEYVNIFFLLLAIFSLRRDASWFRVMLVIVACLATSLIVKRQTGSPAVDIAYIVFLLFFYLVAIRLVGREVLLTGSVDFNKIVGSIALYFLLGLFFSALYALLLHFSPDALNNIEVTRPVDEIPNTVYFSFVTLTTLGYGDISPSTPLARFLVIVESVAGMFYLALIVASLVGSMKHRGH